MVMIIIHHCIVHGLGLYSLSGRSSNLLILEKNQMLLAFAINSLMICAVNCFILISGYFKITVTSKKFINLLLTLLFYTILLTIIPYLFIGNYKDAIYTCFFISKSPYWFVIDYLFLLVCVPLLNIGFDRLTISKRRMILVGMIIISCYFGFVWGNEVNVNGYTLFQFITMYCIGREIRLSKFSCQVYKSLLIYIIISITIGFIGYILWTMGKSYLAYKTTYYNDPLLIITSVSLFMVFKHLNIKSESINKWAKSAFGVYLFQSSIVVSKLIYTSIQEDGTKYGNFIFLIIIGISLGITLISLIFDRMRLILVDLLTNLILSKSHSYKNTI